MHARRIRLSIVSAASVVIVAVVYVIAIRTHIGQRIDSVAFQRHSIVTAAMTRRTDRLLGTVSVATLFGFGSAIVLIALARRRVSLALAAGVAMSGAVLTTEVLKKLILTRPDLGFGGVSFNTYPSGHATIGMTLSLGAVMVAPVSLRRPALLIAALTSTAFGTAVLSSGWHRPSDTIGAYFVSLAWFAAASAAVTDRDQFEAARITARPDPKPSPPLLVGAAIGVLAILMFVLYKSVNATGLHTVVYAAPYVLACIGIDGAGVLVVGTFYVLQRTTPRLTAGARTRVRARA